MIWFVIVAAIAYMVGAHRGFREGFRTRDIDLRVRVRGGGDVHKLIGLDEA